jgi:hypothetical protein
MPVYKLSIGPLIRLHNHIVSPELCASPHVSKGGPLKLSHRQSTPNVEVTALATRGLTQKPAR